MMIKIITDSTCDIPQDLIDRYDIHVIPQLVIWGEEQYRDRVDMQPEEFYQRLESDPLHPHSSQAGLLEFQNAYQHAFDQGAHEIMVLTVSGAMSGTYQMAQKAAESFHKTIAVIDSKGPTMSLGWQVLAAARALAEGADLEEIVQIVARVRSKLVQLVGMDTLKYLQKGGRIGEAVTWAGTLLNVKPLVSINHQKGVVQPVGLVRTYKNMLDQLYRRFFDQVKPAKNLRVAVLHGNVEDTALEMAHRIRQEYDPLELLVNITTPVLGIHTGPRALALCGYCE